MAATAMLEIQVNAIKWAVNYHPILKKIGTQTKRNMLRLKITRAEVQVKLQDGRRRHVGS
jgi:hypothetical protein